MPQPLEDGIYQRAYQIAGLVQTCVQERNIVLNPRIHFVAYTVALRDALRTPNIPECRCTCNACDGPGNVNRDPVSEDGYADNARLSAIAEQDNNCHRPLCFRGSPNSAKAKTYFTPSHELNYFHELIFYHFIYHRYSNRLFE